jgi:hypothetical protein
MVLRGRDQRARRPHLTSASPSLRWLRLCLGSCPRPRLTVVNRPSRLVGPATPSASKEAVRPRLPVGRRCWVLSPKQSLNRRRSLEDSDREDANDAMLGQSACDDYKGFLIASVPSGLEALFASIPLVPDAKKCEVCGSPIDPHPLKRYCSDSCRQKARSAREAPRRRRKPVPAPRPVEDPGPRTSVPAKLGESRTDSTS